MTYTPKYQCYRTGLHFGIAGVGLGCVAHQVSVAALHAGHSVLGAVPAFCYAVEGANQRTTACVYADFGCGQIVSTHAETVVFNTLGSEYIGRIDGMPT